jgi:hypothetical protein
MPRVYPPPVHITPYERATLYYTLPRIVRPLRPVFVLVYSIVLLGLLAALTWAAIESDERAIAILMGLIILAALIGIAATMGHALLNEIRTRRLLKEARESPPVQSADPSLPDPFEGHVLLRHPGNADGQLTACSYDDEHIAYILDNTLPGGVWQVRSPQDEPRFTIHRGPQRGSFYLLPSRQREYFVRDASGDTPAEIAHIRPAGTPLRPQTEIRGHNPARTYCIRDNAIYLDTQLLGRIYYTQGAWFLDIKEDHLNEGILAYFVTLV